MAVFPNLNNSELERVSNILGDTSNGFTGSEIGRLLTLCSIPDACPGGTKRIRLFNSFVERCNRDNNSNCVYAFIQEALMPSRWMSDPQRRENIQTEINEVLALKGIQVNEKNQFVKVQVAETLRDAKRRASQLSHKLYEIHAHYRVMQCCKEELLAEDYFHAVHEAAKSLTHRIAEETGLQMDGTALIECSFSTNNPAIVMNTLRTESEKNEHRGLKEMLLGVNYAVRNVTSHEMRIKWAIDEDEAVVMLSIISALHKQLDGCHFIRQGLL